jgi:DNA-binding transcriptional LysR family regulator
MPQPWISVQIRQLEERLGLTLFDRTKRHVALTPDGEDILSISKIIEQQIEKIERISIRHNGNNIEEKLTIGAFPDSVHDNNRNQIIRGFIKNYNIDDVVIVNRYFSDLYKMLINKEVDIIFAPLPTPLKGLDSISVSKFEIVMLMPSNNPLAKNSTITPEMIKNKRIISGEKQYSDGLVIGHDHKQFFKDVDWVIPPETSFESRPLMVQIIGLPSVWIDYPDFNASLGNDYAIRHLSRTMFYEFGFIRVPGRKSETEKKFWRYIEKYVEDMNAMTIS